jgi:DNA-binding MarR family transcriptional regulator
MREPELSARRLRTWIRLLRMTRATENHLREYLRLHHDTTLPRFDVMAALHRAKGPMKMSDLSRQLLVSNGNATAVVERLEKEGLASRAPSEGDRRVVLAELTDKGRDVFEAQATGHRAEVDRLFSMLGHEELDALRDILHRVEEASDGQDG